MTTILNRYIFSCIALLLLVTQSFSAQAAGLPWWDTNYNLRQEITITTGANTPANGYSGYTVRDTNLNTAALITTNNLQADCDDLRVARWDGSTWTEVDRHLLNCNTATTDIRFKLLVDIPASSSDVSYYFYYDNSSANAPNALDTTNVYVWYDDASTDRRGSYTFGRGDNWHGTGGTNSFTYNGTSYSYNTGDNVTNSMRRAVNERDVYIEAEFFHTNAFPNDMTSGLVTRYQSSGGSGSSESANHYYASNRADSPFLGDAGYTHDVSIMKGNRGTIAIGPADGVGAPAIAGNQWRRQALATWNVNNTNGKFWDNNDTTALGPSGWPSVAATKSGADTGTDYEGSGDAGLMVAQDQALVRNILIRRYVEAEPVLSLSTVDSQLIAYYANDETNWIGAGGEVIDQSINAYHGQAVNGAVTTNADPALTGDPGTCGYGNFDGNDDYVALPATFPNLQDSFTITAWIQADSGDRDRRIFADDETNSGGYALSLGDPGPGQLRFFSRNVSPVSLDTGMEILPNRWYFISAVHNATTKTREIYVNGTLVANDAYTGTWGTDAGIASVGGETSAPGNTEATNNFRFDGDIDEVRVYSQPLTGPDITTVMNLRHPCSIGPAATCGPIPSTYPIYSAGNDLDIDDDVTINGSIAVEEGDNNGNAIDTTLPAGNNVTTATQTLPTIDPDTFPSTGTLNVTVNNTASGVDRTIDIADSPPDDGSYNNINVNDNATLEFTGGGPFYIDRLRIEENATVIFNAGTYFIDQLQVRDDNATIDINGEVRIFIGDHFITGNNDDNLSVNAGGNVSDLVVFLYPNATFDMDGEDLNFTGVIYGPNSGDIKINDNSTIKGAIIGGDEIELDEDVNIIYDATVAAAVASITTCSSATISNFTVTHNQFGLNCATESITINAIDTDGMPYDAGGVVMTINTTTGSGNWSVITGTAANLNNGTNNNGIATYTFASGETGVVLGLDYLQGTNTFTITATATVNGNPISALGVLPITFTPETFIISDTAPPDPLGATPPSFPSQIAGTNVTTHITAYGTQPTAAGCGVISDYTGNKNLAMWTDYLNPLAPTATTAMTITDVNDTLAIGDTETNAIARLVNFAAGRATVTAKYKDVGLIRLSAKDANANPDDLPTGIRGSADIIFRPADILIDAVTLADGSGNFLNVAGDITAPKFIGAGNPFGIRVRAVDADGDVTPNYGRENLPMGLGPEGVLISSSTLVAPSPTGTPAGVNGTIGNPAAFSPTTDIDGTPLAGGYLAGSNFTFSEVGIIKLTAVVADGDYLGTGLEAASSTESTNVGRFVPDRFNVTVDPLTLADSCGAFSYMDQNIDFTASPTITLEAVQENGVTTKNYDIDMFWRYSVDLANRTYTNNSATPATLDSNPLPANISVSGDNDANGIGLLTITNEPILYQRPSDPRDTINDGADPAIPFSADINLDFTIDDLKDADGVCYDENNDDMCKPYSISNITGTQVRFGRLKIDSAFGSELVNLELPVTPEYYDSLTNDFVTATDDMCTALTIAPAGPPTWGHFDLPVASYTGNLSSGDTTPTLSAFISGQAILTLSSPGVGNDGSVIVSPLLNSAIPLVQPWLQFDWDGDGNHDNDPTATATFGIYRGNDSTIYLRELY